MLRQSAAAFGEPTHFMPSLKIGSASIVTNNVAAILFVP
jgi:hypothetical protein